LAENLDALYEYAAHQLLMANLRNEDALLDEILLLLNDLKASWVSIDPVLQPAADSAAQTTAADPARDTLSYGRA
jgi:flagellar protein FliS